MKSSTSRSRHGLNALKARVKIRRLQAIDARTAAAQALLAWRDDLLADLGGEDVASSSQRALVELATRTRLYIDHLARRRTVLPVVRERQQLADSLARIVGQLSLERKKKVVTDLKGYLANRYGDDGAGTVGSIRPPVPGPAPEPPTDLVTSAAGDNANVVETEPKP